MHDNQFVLLAYSERILHDSPNALQESKLWRAVTHLVNFEVIQWYQPDRVM